MKNFRFLIYSCLFIISTSYLRAQEVIDVITNVNLPTALFVENDNLFFGDFNGGLSRVQLSDPSSPEVVYPSAGIYRTAISGNELYITAINSGVISKIDITENDPTATEIASDLLLPSGIAIGDGILYFTEQANGSVSKLDLSESEPVITIVASGFDTPTGIALVDNELFIAEFTGNKVSKIDISMSNPPIVDVATNLLNPTEIFANGSQLLVSEFSANKVISIDLTANPPTVADLVTNIASPTGLYLDGTDLYISVFGENRIVKFQTSTLGIADINSSSLNLTLFPNPSSDYIQLLELNQKVDYTIHSMLGSELLSGTLVPNQKINIQKLNKGTYFLRLDDKRIIKFARF